jgi:hypothetical protein
VQLILPFNQFLPLNYEPFSCYRVQNATELRNLIQNMKTNVKTLIAFFLLLMSKGYGQMGGSYPSNANVATYGFELKALDPTYAGSGNATIQGNAQAEQYWQEVIHLDAGRADAWLSYYQAVRFKAEAIGQSRIVKSRLDSIETAMQAVVAGTWEQFYVHYWNGNHDLNRFSSLEKAYKMNSDHEGILRQMIGYYAIIGDLTKAGKYTAEWEKTGYLTNAYSEYAYNVLQSIAQSSILITNGEFDTYPILKQQSSGVRSDVKVLDLSLAANAHNRALVLRRIGLKLPSNDSVSVFDAAYIRKLAAANPYSKIYLASTVGSGMLQLLKDQLFITGLAFRYSTVAIENLNFLKENMGEKMKLDELGNGKGTVKEKMLQLNYVLPLELAAQEYDKAGDAEKAKKLRDTARKIGISTGREKDVNAILTK